jgi:hypothetical protein
VVSAVAGHANPTITLHLCRTVYKDEHWKAVYSLTEILTTADSKEDEDDE